jgi:hypothetical protein
MRYFARETFGGSLHGLYRFEATANSFVEQYWTAAGWHRDDDAKIVGYLALGEGDLKELSESVARSHMPGAFDSENASVILPQTYISSPDKPASIEVFYKVVYLGSSIVGLSFDFDSYESARTFLQEKSNKGKAKCFKWWCEICKEKPLEPGDSPLGHFIEVSIPNVLTISNGRDVKWIWENPESEWAVSRGKSAAEEFQSLVDRKSRPNWKICINTYLA